MHTVLERGRDAHRNPCAHSYCVPAPPHAEKYPILAHYVCISIAFLLFPSTFFRAHFYCVPALSACISIALQHSLHAFLLYPSTIFQHCMRAFLIYSGMDGWVDGWVDGWMGGWMDGWVGWVDGGMDAFFVIDNPTQFPSSFGQLVPSGDLFSSQPSTPLKHRHHSGFQGLCPHSL